MDAEFIEKRLKELGINDFGQTLTIRLTAADLARIGRIYNIRNWGSEVGMEDAIRRCISIAWLTVEKNEQRND